MAASRCCSAATTCPVFRPTEEEFRDFRAYLEKIDPVAGAWLGWSRSMGMGWGRARAPSVVAAARWSGEVADAFLLALPPIPMLSRTDWSV